MRKPPFHFRRSGVAAVEFAFLLPLLLLLLCGVWIVGRMILTHQIVDWAAREGARVASQGQIVIDSGYQQITKVGSTPSVYSVVNDFLKANRIDTTGLVVDYVNLSSGQAEPWQAVKGDLLQITVSLPHANVRLPVPTWALPNPEYLTATLQFHSLQDDPFSLIDTLPIWEEFK